ncbi:unnamed protein product [Thelazia callipaeda]|uniref:Epimerase domain-containing protein n=1 Tax=Thelazia callipaeda TaxID=103827 RepID=A0A0N5CX68_THECL|nr:unnamed protein product [Thelazia callipaeda]
MIFPLLSDLITFIGFYFIAAYCIVVEFYMDRIRRYNGLSRLQYLHKAIFESKFFNASNQKLIAVVTGADGTIGTEVTRLLLQNNFKVICLIRNRKSCNWSNEFGNQADLVIHTVDLANLQEVKQIAKIVAEQNPQIDFIVCAAGVMLFPFERTESGFETHYAVNFLSHAIIVNYLLPSVAGKEGDRHCNEEGKIIFVSSAAAYLYLLYPVFCDPKMLFNYRNGYQAYWTSKFAMSSYADELNYQMQQQSIMSNQRKVTVISLHPGCVASNLYQYANIWTKILIFRLLWRIMRNPAIAAAEILALGFDDNLIGGCYYQHMVPTRISSCTEKQQLYKYVQEVIKNL